MNIIGLPFARMIKTLKPKDAQHLRATEGWLELGDNVEVTGNLERNIAST